jgi:hypothetical protein
MLFTAPIGNAEVNPQLIRSSGERADVLRT